jgi:hypothetical protein
MTVASAIASFPLARAANARARRPAIAFLFLTIVLALFSLSSGQLWELGINYDGVTGAMASKIHPATYLALLTLMILIPARRNPASYVVGLITRHPGTLTFLIATLVLAAYIVFDGRKGIATIFDTYLLAIVVVLIAAENGARDMERVEKLIHLVMAANAILALVEYAIDYRFFPYRFEGLAFEWDRRSTGLLGHPLENAQTTGVYLMALLGGGGVALAPALRIPAMLLQLAALVPFGGRTALLLACAMIALWMVPRAVRVLLGGRLSLLAYAALAMLAPLLVFAIGAAAAGGFFEVILERFRDDGGSAESRLAMFELFAQLSAHDLLVGANPEFVDSLRRTMGLEWGIENPVVRLVLYQGVIFTSFLVAGFALFLFEIARSLRPGYGAAFLFFLVIISSYESISNKTVSLAQFAVLMLAMFRKPEPSFPQCR